MTVLITGASGLLGRELMKTFSDRKTVGLCHRRKGPHLRQADLRDQRSFKALLDEIRPDLVIHSAAYRDPDYCEENRDDAKKLNVESVGVLLDNLPEHARIVFMSTDYLFDGESPPYAEESERNPVNFYGQSKLLAEDILMQRSNSLALRIPVLIGLDDSFEDSGFVYKLVSAVRGGQQTELDNIHVRYPTWTRDVAEAVRFAFEIGAVGRLNFSGPTGGTQYELALEVADFLGEDCGHIKPAQKPTPRKARRPIDSHLSPAKIKRLGFREGTPFRAALENILNEAESG